MNKNIYKLLFVSLILTLIFNYLGFSASFKRKRDLQRINDIGEIERGLILYKSEFGEFPKSSISGKIIGCKGPNTDYERDKNGKVVPTEFKKFKYVNLIECNWGDPLLDAGDTNYPAYISRIPTDPLSNENVSYLYYSDGVNFKIMGHLEMGSEHRDYNKDFEMKNVSCGTKICNFGRSSGITLTEIVQ